MLAVRGVSKRFRGVTALRDVSLTVDGGEIVGLIGPNGAGKTTLFHLISGFARPDAGSVTFRGQDVGALPAHEVRRLGLARTFQVVQPFVGMSVRDNVAVAVLFGRDRRRHGIAAAREESNRLLDVVGLAAAGDAAAASLNLVERKRLELARALGTNPALLCLDEVLAGLNPGETDRMAATVRGLNDRLGVAILMIEHNVGLVAALCQRVVVLDQGSVIADGATAAVLADPAVVRAYLGERRRPPSADA
ncbi:MAG: ABC transporter ATP-binding protein [Armatimonadetes bacterium]|nr:ABC transporter ATP-binding protein [Armatimonadota bacterium]